MAVLNDKTRFEADQPELRQNPPLLKRPFDVVVACAMLIVLAPLMLLVALVLSFEGGPVLFGHTRIGRHGRPFRCWKFRSMVPDAAARLDALLASDPQARQEWNASRKLKNDPRITGFGHFLRKSSIDELPQLFNVLAGEMSLVGPRPVVADELALYGEARADYLAVRPGLTGLWQVSGRSDLDYEARVALDRSYVQSQSMGRDILIMLKTILILPTKAAGAY